MGKYKENAKYHVVSMRISNEEKLVLEEMMRDSRTTISGLLRQAIQLYAPQMALNAEQG